MRGRIVNPFTIEFAQLDTVATAADPDAGGAETAGYDTDFREPVLLPAVSSEGPGIVNRKETTLRMVGQVEVEKLDATRAMAAGIAPGSLMRFVFHYCDIERAGLLDPITNGARVRVGDRVTGIYTCDGLTLVRAFPNPPGLYVTVAEDTGFGFGGARNLFIVTVEPRDRGVQS